MVLFDGRLIRIDTAISAAYGGPWTYLEIQGDKITPHRVHGQPVAKPAHNLEEDAK